MSKYFGIPFANSGDKTTIPEALQPDGFVSFTEGYTPDYEADQTVDPDAKDVSRQAENYFKFVVTEALKEIQEYGGKVYDPDVNYPVNAITIGSDGFFYRCIVANGPDNLPIVDPVGDTSGRWLSYDNSKVDSVSDLRAISYTPVDGQVVNILGYYTPGDGGGQFVYWDGASVETHNGVDVFELSPPIGAGRFKKYNDGIYKFKQAGLKLDGTDDSAAMQNFFDVISSKDAVINTQSGDCLIDNPVVLESNKRYIFTGNVNIIVGPSFAEGGANVNSHVMTLRGGTPRTVTTTNLFYNYWKEASVSDVPKGTRILISDNNPANYWDVGGNNYRNSLQTFVDYADTVNNIVNFYPEINFPVALDNVATKEIDDTDIIILVYEDDIKVEMGSGIKFTGGLNTLATYTTRAYAKGLLVKRGRFNINADFIEISDALRIEEGLCYYQGIMQGGYSTAGGNGVKPVQGSTVFIDNSTITGFRHAIGVAGSTQDGASAYISNSVLTDARQSNNSNTYPQDESRALDGHGNTQIVRVVNCDIRGVQTGGGIMELINCKIHTQTNPCIELRGGDAADNGEIRISDSDVYLPPDIPSNADSVGGGAGTFDSTIYFLQDGGLASVATGWKAIFSNVRFRAADSTNYPASTVLHVEPGNHDFDSVVFKNKCQFLFEGTNIREIAIDPKVVDGIIDIGDTEFYGCALTIGVRNSIGTAWKELYIDKALILNTDTLAGQFYSHGLQITGDTTVSSNNRKIQLDGSKIKSYGSTGGVTINDCVWEGLNIKNVDLTYTDPIGTLGYGIRTNRNQNVNTSNHFITHIDGNTINNAPSSAGNTITVGIQVNGLNAVGGSGLPAGFYTTGTNAVKGATTPITTTGTALTGV